MSEIIEIGLNQKLQRMQQTIALPSVEEWPLAISNPADKAKIVSELNAGLLDILKRSKAGEYKSEPLMLNPKIPALGNFLKAVDTKYPEAGIQDYGVYTLIGCFFALNEDPSQFTLMNKVFDAFYDEAEDFSDYI